MAITVRDIRMLTKRWRDLKA